MFIVSANYRDRQSDLRWLVRGENEDPEKSYKAMKSVDATQVRFVESSGLEQGFGCSMVARCETVVEISEPPPAGGQKLQFAEFFFLDQRGKRVKGCERLVLGPNGSMTAFKLEY